MTELIWSAAAETDLVGILEYYSAIDEELAARLVENILREPLRLLDFPKMGAPAGARDIRKWQVHGTPFLLFYRAGDGRVEVRRIRHVREDWRPL